MILKCDAECNHDHNVEVGGVNYLDEVLKAGWVVHLWDTPHNFLGHEHGPDHAHDEAGNDAHIRVYCDAFCAYVDARRHLLDGQEPYPEMVIAHEHEEPASTVVRAQTEWSG